MNMTNFDYTTLNVGDKVYLTCCVCGNKKEEIGEVTKINKKHFNVKIGDRIEQFSLDNGTETHGTWDTNYFTAEGLATDEIIEQVNKNKKRIALIHTIKNLIVPSLDDLSYDLLFDFYVKAKNELKNKNN